MERSSVERLASIRPSERTVRTTGNRGYVVPGDERVRDDRRRPTPGGGGTALAERGGGWRWRQRIRTTLDLIRSNPTGRIALKIFISVAGAIVVAIGVVLIPLPGPGWLLVIAGLGIWAVEFHWARRLLGFTRRHVHNWTRWAASRSLPVRLALGTVGLVFVGAVVLMSLKVGLGIDVVARALHYLATH